MGLRLLVELANAEHVAQEERLRTTRQVLERGRGELVILIDAATGQAVEPAAG